MGIFSSCSRAIQARISFVFKFSLKSDQKCLAAQPWEVAVVIVDPTVTNPTKSVPMDPRYPNQNQTKNCWQNYVDYYRCINKRGEDYEPCQFFFKNYNTICPLSWVERWNDQREAGAFPSKLD